MKSSIQHINPDGMHKNPAFTQVISVQGPGKTIYVGGQDSVNAKGEIVGKGDLAAQTEQVMQNLQAALEACGAGFEHVVKMNIYLLHGQDLRTGFVASQKYLGHLKNPPAISGLMVAGLAHPDFLVEVDAIAFLPEG